MIEYCVCGHDYTAHGCTSGGWCFPCYNKAPLGVESCEQYKLDNLKLIEDLAKEKGLV